MVYDFCKLIAVEGRLCAIDSGANRLNHGSVIETIFIQEKDIVRQPDYNFAFDDQAAAELVGSLVLRSGATGYRFRFTPSTGRFTEPMQETDDGIFYPQLLTIQIPKDRPEITWLKHHIRWGRYAILYRDGNGNTKFIRRQRVKLDLSTGQSMVDYNGHTLVARRSTDEPALHWQLSPTASLESIFTVAALFFKTEFVSLPEGWQAGKVIQLSSTPFSSESMLVIYNQAPPLQAGSHFTLNGDKITLQFADDVASGDPGTIYILYASNDIGTDIGAFVQGKETKGASYSNGSTFALPSSPIDSDNLLIIYNDALTLVPGTDYSLAGNTVTHNWGGDSGDTFRYFFAAAGGGPIPISGWKQYSFPVVSAESSGFTFNLPHTPIANSLMLHYDGSVWLEEGVHFNLTDDEIEILFDLPADSSLLAWYAY